MRTYLLTFIYLSLFSSINAQIGWIQKAGMPVGGKSRLVGFSLGNNAYVGTGGACSKYQFASADFWKWNSLTNTWIQVANVPGPPRVDAFAFSVGNKGYVGGGWSGNSFLQDFWEYDPVANAWAPKTIFSSGSTYALTAFTIGTKGYVLSDTTLWEYEQSTDTWIQKAAFPGGARNWASAFSIGNKGYIVGGQKNDAFPDFWCWDQSTDTWTEKTDYAGGAQSGLSAFTIGNKAYVGNTDFYEWDEARNSWAKIETLSSMNRQGAVSLAINGKGYVCGGSYSGVGYCWNELWEYKPCTALQVANATICIGNSCTLNATGATNYSWSTSSTNSSIVVSPTLTTTYTVSSSGADNCIVTRTIDVTVNTPPSLTISATATNICSGKSVTLQALGAHTYSWMMSDGYIGASSIKVTPYMSTTYTVWGETPACGLDTKTQSVIVRTSPNLQVSGNFNVIICAGSATLTATGALSYSWSTNQYTPVIIVSPSVTTIYTVDASNLNGCYQKAIVDVNVYPCAGLSENTEQGTKIKLYPNPSSGKFTIECAEGAQIVICNSMGQEIRKYDIGSKSSLIDLENQPKGIYNAKIFSEGEWKRFSLVKQ
jgi:N-acetylneuraminic acid mutarotase